MTSLKQQTNDSVKSKAGYHIKVNIPGLPKPSNQLLRRHWSLMTKEKNNWYKAVGLAIPYPFRPKNPLKKAIVSFGRYSTTSPDYDGLVSSFKWVCDALTHYKIIENDKMANIGMPHFYWEKAPRGKGFISIEIFEHLS